jgi:hypothetical protein
MTNRNEPKELGHEWLHLESKEGDELGKLAQEEFPKFWLAILGDCYQLRDHLELQYYCVSFACHLATFTCPTYCERLPKFVKI